MIELKKTDDEIEECIYTSFYAVIHQHKIWPTYMDFFDPCKDQERAYELLDKFIKSLVLIVRTAYGLAAASKILKACPSPGTGIKRLDKTLINIEKAISDLEKPYQYFGVVGEDLLYTFRDQFNPMGDSPFTGLNLALENLYKIRDGIKAARQSYDSSRTERTKNMALPYVAEAITKLFEGGDCGAFSLYENGLACQSVVTVMACINHNISPQTARTALAKYSKNRNYITDFIDEE